MESASCENLKGHLRKLGEKGPRRTWKKRYFLQTPEHPNRLYYYVTEKTQTEQGFVNLEEAIAVLRTTDGSSKHEHCFQINTPRRIYRLRADSENEMNHWIDGINKAIKRISSAGGETDSQLLLQLEHANNRISDLEVENAKYRRALQLASVELKFSAESILRLVEQGIGSLDGHLPKSEAPETFLGRNASLASLPTDENDYTSSLDSLLTTNLTKQLTEMDFGNQQRTKPSAPEEDHPEGNDSDSSEETESEVDTSSHFGAQVLYDYNARKNYELSIEVNEIITVISKHENGWWLGCNREGKQGYFPGSYVRPLLEEGAVTPA